MAPQNTIIILKLLDPIHHQGLRIALGAFRTSPVQSLYAEAGEPSLRHRRLKLSMNYFLKLKSLPDNPCHHVINNPPPSELFERTKTIPPFGTRTLPHIEEANIEPNSIDSQYERTPPPLGTQQYYVRYLAIMLQERADE